MSDVCFGVMQGRLLPKYKGRYQAHPVGYWQDEFDIAEKLRLDCIEFILDYDDAYKNPLLNKSGISQICDIVQKTSVRVKTICADYFMEAPLHTSDESVSESSLSVLTKLINNSYLLGVTDIVIPCVDQSSLNSDEKTKLFIKKVKRLIPLIEKYEMNLSLETDLPPESFIELLESFQTQRITVNYDIGNSASLGYDPQEELQAYGDRISDIHIKDRLLGGGPVMLGKGAANFEKFFKKLKDYNYQGPFIMQAFRDDEGLDVFKKQQLWILDIIQRYYAN